MTQKEKGTSVSQGPRRTPHRFFFLIISILDSYGLRSRIRSCLLLILSSSGAPRNLLHCLDFGFFILPTRPLGLLLPSDSHGFEEKGLFWQLQVLSLLLLIDLYIAGIFFSDSSVIFLVGSPLIRIDRDIL